MALESKLKELDGKLVEEIKTVLDIDTKGFQ
jgi:hypothetical protein